MYLPEVDLKIESMEIKPTNRKLKATWTYEAAQDMRAWMNQDVEDELTKALADEINKEIDNEILNDLREAAEKPWGFRKKKKHPVRKITDDWEVSKQD